MLLSGRHSAPPISATPGRMRQYQWLPQVCSGDLGKLGGLAGARWFRIFLTQSWDPTEGLHVIWGSRGDEDVDGVLSGCDAA
jgi:hypothetical protein